MVTIATITWIFQISCNNAMYDRQRIYDVIKLILARILVAMDIQYPFLSGLEQKIWVVKKHPFFLQITSRGQASKWSKQVVCLLQSK